MKCSSFIFPLQLCFVIFMFFLSIVHLSPRKPLRPQCTRDLKNTGSYLLGMCLLVSQLQILLFSFFGMCHVYSLSYLTLRGHQKEILGFVIIWKLLRIVKFINLLETTVNLVSHLRVLYLLRYLVFKRVHLFHVLMVFPSSSSPLLLDLPSISRAGHFNIHLSTIQLLFVPLSTIVAYSGQIIGSIIAL